MKFIRAKPTYPPQQHHQQRQKSMTASESTSFRLTAQEKELMQMQMTNDKVVNFYKRVLKDVRAAISQERKEVLKKL